MNANTIYLAVRGYFEDKISANVKRAMNTVAASCGKASKVVGGISAAFGSLGSVAGSSLGKVTGAIGNVVGALATLGPIGGLIAGVSAAFDWMANKALAAAKAAEEFAKMVMDVGRKNGDLRQTTMQAAREYYHIGDAADKAAGRSVLSAKQIEEAWRKAMSKPMERGTPWVSRLCLCAITKGTQFVRAHTREAVNAHYVGGIWLHVFDWRGIHRADELPFRGGVSGADVPLPPSCAGDPSAAYVSRQGP